MPFSPSRPPPLLLFVACLVALLGMLPGCAEEADGAATAGATGGAEVRVAGSLQTSLALVIFGVDTVRAEVADTPEARERGLRHRTELPEDGGMLFVYGTPAHLTFWMRDTPLPLDIAFLDGAGVVVDLQAMEPESDRLHTSRLRALYALEVNRGWFERHGVGVGDTARIVFLPRATGSVPGGRGSHRSPDLTPGG